MSMSAPEISSTTVVKFHISLQVADLARSVDFFRVLFHCEPAKQRRDYAKFEPDEPPLVLSLIPGPHSAGGALNHVGIRLADAAALVDVQSRLESAGWQTQREEGVECCYSRQTKFWINDPDGVLWELYVLDEDADEQHSHESTRNAAHVGERSADHSHAASQETATQAKVVWQHLLTQPLPARIEHADESVDQVQLEGTFNLKLEPETLAGFANEVWRILRPGGQLLIHGLAADSAWSGPPPALPGPAALVQEVPRVEDVHRVLVDAGFSNMEVTHLSAKANFKVGDLELREMRMTAVRPGTPDREQVGSVLYRGPLIFVQDDQGNIYPRGERVCIDRTAWDLLRSSSAAEQFVFFAGGSGSGCCD